MLAILPGVTSSDRPESEFRFRFVPIPTFFGRSANSEFRFRSPCDEVSVPISDSDYRFNLNSNGIGTTFGSSDEIGIGIEKCCKKARKERTFIKNLFSHDAGNSKLISQLYYRNIAF